MRVHRFLAPLLCILFGFYCLFWGLMTSSSPLSMRIGGAFFGVLFLLLAFVDGLPLKCWYEEG